MAGRATASWPRSRPAGGAGGRRGAGVDTASPAAQASAASLEPSQDRPHFQEYQLADGPPAEGAEAQPANGVPENGGDQRTFMSPVVARMVSEHNLDIGKIPGTGRGGRVTKKDVERFLAGGRSAAPAGAGRSRARRSRGAAARAGPRRPLRRPPWRRASSARARAPSR